MLRRRPGALGPLAGAGFVSLYVASCSARGPEPRAGHGSSHRLRADLDPVPWLAAGVLLVIGALLLQSRGRG